MCLEHSGQGQEKPKMKLRKIGRSRSQEPEGPGEVLSSYPTWDGKPSLTLSRSTGVQS